MARLLVRRMAGKKAAVCPAHAVPVTDNPKPRRSP
jgi:hypothetical protein